MGLFGVAEVLEALEKKEEIPKVLAAKFKNLFPNLQDWRDSIGAILRGTGLGFFLGLLPGAGPVISSFTSYGLEKRISKHPERFGKGAIEGVAGPESANNSAVSANFIPLMTLGLPANAVMALILGGLLVHGIRPGPMLIQEHPDLFWGVVVSMYAGNVMLLFLNLPLIGIWVRILAIPYRILFPLILLFCLIGVYSLNSNIWEIFIMIIFGMVGYLMRKFKYEATPFVFGLILSPLWENAFRQSMLISEGSFSIFFTRPISCVLMTAAFIVYFLILILPRFKKKSSLNF
jgi:putative tricarboxylic transport membrane protein